MTTTTPTPEPKDDLAGRTFTAIGGPDTNEQAQDGEAAKEPQQLTAAQIIGGALAAGREVFCMVTKLESPRRTLDDDTAQAIGALWGPVLDKHGIDLGKYLGDYALEAAAIIGTITISAGIRKAAIAEMNARERAQEAPSEPVNDAQTVEV